MNKKPVPLEDGMTVQNGVTYEFKSGRHTVKFTVENFRPEVVEVFNEMVSAQKAG